MSRRWKERNREKNRARDREYLARPDRRKACISPICSRLRAVGSYKVKDGYCEECRRAVIDVRRTLAEGMWADGWTTYEIADAFGVTKDRIGIDVARWRHGGYLEAFPHRRTSEQVARIAAGWQRVTDRRMAA